MLLVPFFSCQAIFRTGDGSVGLGLRLDTACYSPAVQHTAGAPTQQGLPVISILWTIIAVHVLLGVEVSRHAGMWAGR